MPGESDAASALQGKADVRLADVQQRVRQLLLTALRTWRASCFGSESIGHLLEYIEGKINKFESDVGQIQNAAAGAEWLAIKLAIDGLLHGVALPEEEQAGKVAFQPQLADTAMRRQERQSNIQGICWNRDPALLAGG